MNVEGDLLPLILRIIGAPVAAFFAAWSAHAFFSRFAEKYKHISLSLKYFISAALSCLIFAFVCLFLCGKIGEVLGVVYTLTFCAAAAAYCFFKLLTSDSLYFYGAFGALLGGLSGIAVHHADYLKAFVVN